MTDKLINGIKPQAFVEQMMADYFTSPTQSPREAIDKYLAPHAVHEADGKSLTRDDFVKHLGFLQKNIKSMTFDFQQVVFDGEWLVVRHFGRTELADGKLISSEVVVFFQINNGKITRSFEVTRPLSGVDADRNIHSAS